MSEIFNNKPSKGHQINRNPFDLSFQTNGSFRFGRLYPVFVKDVIAGEGLTIKPSLGLRSLPMAFPTQTRCKVYMHFWYVRKRNLWRNWMEWIGMTDDVRNSQGGQKKNYEFPWVKLNAARCKTGTLADWMGLPSTFATSEALTQKMTPYAFFGDPKHTSKKGIGKMMATGNLQITSTPLSITSRIGNLYLAQYHGQDGSTVAPAFSGYKHVGVYMAEKLCGTLKDNSVFALNTIGVADGDYKLDLIPYTANYARVPQMGFDITISNNHGSFSLAPNIINNLNKYYKEANGDLKFGISLYTSNGESNLRHDVFSAPEVLCTDANFSSVDYCSFSNVNVASVMDAADAGITPFAGDTPSVKINALPFRAYESIYNAFYRNTQVNPAKIRDTDNGTEYYEYNKFCCDYDGVDTNNYDFHNKNWEQDQFTTMHCSPQLGDAPLVGLSFDASNPDDFRLTIKNVNPIVNKDTTPTASQKIWTFSPEWNADHDHISGFRANEADVPKDLAAIMKASKCGITINDLRNASALQKYLEARIRASYSYRDMMSDVYHIEDLDYNNVAFPEFLGGTSDEININCITNTNGDAEGGLGDYGANATCLSDNNRSINVFCPEHGYVIGLLCIEPVATYSQLLRKDLLVPNSPLDLYTEQMANIGLQPVRAKELTPIQREAEHAIDSTLTQDEVLGYQRPWYEYIRRNDEIHGDMRKDLAGYVITRIFDHTPHLNANFVECKAEDITTPFYDGSIDGFLGMIHFSVGAKLPIPQTDSVHLL